MDELEDTKGSTATLKRQRVIAARLFTSGKSDLEISEQLGVHRGTVWRWRKQWRKGEDAFKAVKKAGRKRRLSQKEEKLVLAALRRGAKRYGFASDSWPLKRIAELIKRLTGVQYNYHYVSEILERIGWPDVTVKFFGYSGQRDKFVPPEMRARGEKQARKERRKDLWRQHMSESKLKTSQ